MNGVSNTFGSIDERTKRFFPRSLATIFEGTNRGVTVKLLAHFVVKASTEDRSALRWDTAQRVSVEVIRAYYVALDVDVQGPTGAAVKMTIAKVLQIQNIYDCLVKLGATKEKRLMIDHMCLRQSYERREIAVVKWIDGDSNPADAMTKSKL